VGLFTRRLFGLKGMVLRVKLFTRRLFRTGYVSPCTALTGLSREAPCSSMLGSLEKDLVFGVDLFTRAVLLK
jgi:hypothetical protein